MNYKELVNIFTTTSLEHQFVKSFNEGDVYDINSIEGNLYGMVVLTPLTHTLGSQTSQYSFNIFYIDRLKKDGTNKLDIQTIGIRTIQDILNEIDLTDDDIVISNIDNITLEVFTEKFADECAGVFGTINLSIMNDAIGCEGLFDGSDPVGTWVDLQITNCEDNYPSLINIAIKQYIRMILQPSFDSSSPTNLYNLYYGTENDPTIVLSGTLNNITIQYS